MRNPLYWTMISAIYRNPGDIFLRSQLADWLDDHGQTKAARLQRIAIDIIRKSVYLVRIFYEKYEQVLGYFYTKKRVVIFQIKKDGRIVLAPKGINLGFISQAVQMCERIKIYKMILGSNPCIKINIKKVDFKNPCNEILLDNPNLE